MRIKVYQIDEDRDTGRTKFLDYESIAEKTESIDPRIYKTVFDGDVGCVDLEEVYALLNADHPPAYQGHSLSVSDVVEVCDNSEEAVGIGCYFCDSVGFRPLADFDSSKAEPLHGKRMVIVEPHNGYFLFVNKV